MKLSGPRQRLAVSEGVALGLLMSGCDQVPQERWRTDLAFGSAWRDWSRAGTFSQVSTDLRNGLNGTIAMTRADRRKQTFYLFWDDAGTSLSIRRRQDWLDVGPEEMAAGIDGDVSAEDWQELAQLFLGAVAP